MTTLAVAFALWVIFCWLPTMVFFTLARRDVTEARRIRDQILHLVEFAEAARVHVSDGVDAAVALAMQEKEGACLQ